MKIKTQYLNHHPVGQSLVGVHLPDFSVAVTEVQLKVDTFTTISGCSRKLQQPALFFDGFLAVHIRLQLQHLEHPGIFEGVNRVTR